MLSLTLNLYHNCYWVFGKFSAEFDAHLHCCVLYEEILSPTSSAFVPELAHFVSHPPYSSIFFFQSTAQLQYVEDSETVQRSTWPLVNSIKQEMQVQEEMDKRFSASDPHGRLPTTKWWIPGYDLSRHQILTSFKISCCKNSLRIFQSRTVHG